MSIRGIDLIELLLTCSESDKDNTDSRGVGLFPSNMGDNDLTTVMNQAPVAFGVNNSKAANSNMLDLKAIAAYLAADKSIVLPTGGAALGLGFGNGIFDFDMGDSDQWMQFLDMP